ncbi:hypothetical protein J4414_01595 [Candidatus Woesearchaeota archaeon]|nr:hypothetical protein [Candidatus Woesearchaeota archaeon]
MKKVILGLIILSIAFIVGCASAPEKSSEPNVVEPTTEAPDESLDSDSGTSSDNNVKGEATADTKSGSKMVEVSLQGFNPSTITVKKGDTVTWTIKGTGSHWPASAVHPTHTAYPGSGRTKCGTDEESNIFDACHALTDGQTFSFQFNEAGSWKYHDHLSPSLTGTVVVE